MKLRSKITYLYIILVVVYAVLLFLVPPPAGSLHKYHISLLELRLVDITVIVPYALIWLAGFYGFTKLKEYGLRIKKSKDGRAVNKIANGILLLVLWLPLVSILSSILNYVVLKHPGVANAQIIINDYFNLVLPLAGFAIVSNGVRELSAVAKFHPSHRTGNLLILAVIGIGVAYGCLLASAVHSSSSSYPLPYWVVMATLVAPYIYMWFLGLWAAYELYLYRNKAPGIIYRKSWSLLAIGIGAIIIIQIVLQYIGTLARQFDKLSFSSLIIVVYIVLIMLAAGYVLVARGARRLQKIEEV